MTDVSTFRLYLMRAAYLLLAVGLGMSIWPDLIHGAVTGHPVTRASQSLLAGLSLMGVIGLRYPLQMLPAMFFEMTWKAIWLIAVALPLWSTHQFDADTHRQAVVCLMAMVVCPIVIPWGYVLANYVRKPGDRWTGRNNSE
jgi:hypothetical protein